jgi:hypothetical protein
MIVAKGKVMVRWALTLAVLLGIGPAFGQDISGIQSGAINIQAMPGSSAGLAPFIRTGDPFVFPAGPQPQQYDIVQPDKTTSYRLVNPCGVDIRIKSVPNMGTGVTLVTGTRFLARTVETMASTPNPNPAGGDRIISVMTTGDPGPAGCSVELTYGNGG